MARSVDNGLPDLLRESRRAEAIAMSDWQEARIAGYDEESARAAAVAAQDRRESLEAALRRSAGS